MGANQNRKPPRPRIELVGGNPSPQDGAAIVAALERFLEESAPPATETAPQSRWQQAALREGVARSPLAPAAAAR